MKSHRASPPLTRLCLIAVALMAVAGATTACRGSREPSPSTTTLQVGDQRGSTRAILEAAGELKNVPYKIQWSLFPVGSAIDRSHEGWGGRFWLCGQLHNDLGLSAGAPIKAINVWRIDGPGSGILVAHGSTIFKVADLKGRSVAVVRGSPGHLLVVEALRQAGGSPRSG